MNKRICHGLEYSSYADKEVLKLLSIKENAEIIFDSIKLHQDISVSVKLYNSGERDMKELHINGEVIQKTSHSFTVVDLLKPWKRATITINDIIQGDITIREDDNIQNEKAG